ncbi:Uncharacterised protein [Bordetella ansorpii]|uniref:Uncharacterized protein n=1 Tax=Bordetella ansorpii TaxID=288768 RepID=A0A157SL55_9BORD|nr:Uncharacterised protein [Bordetella ansorpii]
MRHTILPWGAFPLGETAAGARRARLDLPSRRDGGFCFMGALMTGAEGTA